MTAEIRLDRSQALNRSTRQLVDLLGAVATTTDDENGAGASNASERNDDGGDGGSNDGERNDDADDASSSSSLSFVLDVAGTK